MVMTWVAMAEFLQSLGSNYDKPFFQRYFIQSFYILGIPLWWLARAWRRRAANVAGTGPLLQGEESNYEGMLQAEPDGGALAAKPPSAGSKLAQQVKVGTILGVISFFSGWIWYVSLPLTSVAANTTIYQSASVFVYLLSIPLLNEPVTTKNAVAVVVSLLGVGLIAFAPKGSEATGGHKSTVMGYVFTFVTTILYSIWEVTFKVLGPEEEDDALVEDSCLIFGLCGVANILLVWPGLFVVDAVGYETFQLPPHDTLTILIINGFMDAVFNVLLVLGIALTSPLFVTCGTMLAIPASILWDFIAHGTVDPTLTPTPPYCNAHG
jgi:hypothetical protein